MLKHCGRACTVDILLRQGLVMEWS